MNRWHRFLEEWEIELKNGDILTPREWFRCYLFRRTDPR